MTYAILSAQWALVGTLGGAILGELVRPMVARLRRRR